VNFGSERRNCGGAQTNSTGSVNLSITLQVSLSFSAGNGAVGASIGYSQQFSASETWNYDVPPCRVHQKIVWVRCTCQSDGSIDCVQVTDTDASDC
jgi:hypothetical protein